MGYRSDVQAVIYGPSDDMLRFVTASKMNDKFKPIWTEMKTELHIFTTGAGKTNATTFLHLNCKDVKWYLTYPDVQAWSALMREAEEEFDLQYELIRVGEEDGDVERDQSADCDWILGTSRPEIYLDVNESMKTEGFPNETDNSSTSEK